MQETPQNPQKEILAINIEDEMRSSYMDYAMSVIIGRALPEGRDGLKPVHRRILYAMFKEGLLASKRYSKCAGVVGEVLKKYHPHGDSAVYDSMVRMAQPWNMRYPLIDGQGNFGSIDGDSAAAYRYTECRLTKLAEEMMADIDKETVTFVPNFDGSVDEPTLLPTKIPNLLINGSDGIAVGMATKIPPHNLGEVVNALIALIDNPALGFDELMKIIPGPDFPTAGIIQGRQGIFEAYKAGRGRVVMRAKAEIEPIDKTERERIVVTEIPFQTNKARILENIAELVSDDKIEGIADLRDESDRDGMRMVIDLKKGANSNVVLNQLFKHTALQSSFGVIMLTIIDGRPRVIGMLEALRLFLKHRKEVVIRRTIYDLKEAEKRAHILLGLKIAVENIDEVIALIKASDSPEQAKIGLCNRFKLSEIQAQAILDMRLQKLTGLERDKIIAEYEEVLALISKLKEILGSEKLIFAIIRDELTDVRDRFADARRTVILDAAGDDIAVEDLIQEENMVVTVSHLGYVKRTPLTEYRVQKRGGKGLMGMATRDEDFVEKLFTASTHATMLVFTSLGRVHWLKVYEIPEAGRATRGKAINNLVQLASGEKVAAILPIQEFRDDQYVLFATRGGTVKKTSLSEYSRPRAGGIIAIGIEDDELIQVRLTSGKHDVMLSTAMGQSIRFGEDDVRSMGRGASGVRGISLAEGDTVVSLDVVEPDQSILTVSERGYGKRTAVEDYRVQGRGGSGIITMKTTDKTGLVISSSLVSEANEVMLITDQGKTIRQPVKDISIIGRNTQGVKLINVDENEKVVSATVIVSEDDVTEETVS